MITLDNQDQRLVATVLGEFTLSDFREFESAVLAQPAPATVTTNLLFDLREMAGFTVDVVLEELRFSRRHASDFRRIAIISHSPWVAWNAWLEQAFIASEIKVFDDAEDALAWLTLPE